APAAGELAEVLERGTHRDRVRVPGVVQEQAAARQLELLVAHVRELDVETGGQLEPERTRRRERGERVQREVPCSEADLDLAERRAQQRRLEGLDAHVFSEPYDLEVVSLHGEVRGDDRRPAGRQRGEQLRL